jgi:hypothetical protein
LEYFVTEIAVFHNNNFVVDIKRIWRAIYLRRREHHGGAALTLAALALLAAALRLSTLGAGRGA